MTTTAAAKTPRHNNIVHLIDNKNNFKIILGSPQLQAIAKKQCSLDKLFNKNPWYHSKAICIIEMHAIPFILTIYYSDSKKG